jgi:hypothetical protein
MARRPLPALIVFTALLFDVGGGHDGALVLLLLAIPAAFVLLLECYGDRVEGRCGVLRPALAGLALFLVVLSAALRSPAVVGGLPRFAVSALVVTLFLYAAVAVGALFAPRRTAVVPLRAEEPQARRRRAA